MLENVDVAELRLQVRNSLQNQDHTYIQQTASLQNFQYYESILAGGYVVDRTIITATAAIVKKSISIW